MSSYFRTLKETLPWIAKAVVSVLIGFQATKVVGTFLLNNTSLLVVVVGSIVVTTYVVLQDKKKRLANFLANLFVVKHFYATININNYYLCFKALNDIFFAFFIFCFPEIVNYFINVTMRVIKRHALLIILTNY